MKVSVAQLNPKLGDFAENKQKIRQAIRRAKDEGANILILPFGALTGFPVGNLVASRDFREKIQDSLEELALETKNESLVVFSGGEEILKDGTIIGAQLQKEGDRGHFSFMGFGFNNMEVVVNLGPKVFEKNRPEAHELELRLLATEKKSWVFDINLAGATDEILFSGLSSVFNPDGLLMCRLNFAEEDFLTLDLDSKEPSRIEEIPAGEDILIRAITTGIRDYFTKNNFPKILVSVSGGIDSALVLALAVRAVGKDKVDAVYLPSRFSSDISRQEANAVCKNLGVSLQEISIDPYHNLFLNELRFLQNGNKVWEENIQARVRGNIVMSLANAYQYLVLATGNKSEAAVGYCTLYGDTCGGFAPICDLLKTEVRAICRFLNLNGEIIPEQTISRPPSAELREGQKDEDSLPDYAFLDQVLYLHCEEGQDFHEISHQLGRSEDVRRIFDLVYKNDYKRRQMALGLKLSKRYFGLDWHIPSSVTPWY